MRRKLLIGAALVAAVVLAGLLVAPPPGRDRPLDGVEVASAAPDPEYRAAFGPEAVGTDGLTFSERLAQPLPDRPSPDPAAIAAAERRTAALKTKVAALIATGRPVDAELINSASGADLGPGAKLILIDGRQDGAQISGGVEVSADRHTWSAVSLDGGIAAIEGRYLRYLPPPGTPGRVFAAWVK